jgi:hypothetical protein
LTIQNRNDDDVHKKVYKGVEYWLKDYIKNYIGVSAQDGYMPEIYLAYNVLPMLHEICSKSEFKQILQELTLDPNVISTAKYVYTDIITGSQCFFNDMFKNDVLEMYMKMLPDVQYEVNSSISTTAVLEMYPEPTNLKIGHAATLVRTQENELYVIDDTRTIKPIGEYCKEYSNKLARIDVRDIDEKTVGDINSKLKSKNLNFTGSPTGFFKHRIARYTLDFSSNFISQSEFEVHKSALSLSGGGVTEEVNIWKYIAIVLFIIVIIETVVMLMRPERSLPLEQLGIVYNSEI